MPNGFCVAQIYVTFLDSSAYYVERLYRLASGPGRGTCAASPCWATSTSGWGGAGSLARLFRKIDTLAGMTPGEYRAWHSRYSSVASRRYDEAADCSEGRGAIRFPISGSSRCRAAATRPVRAWPPRGQRTGRYDEALQLLEPLTAKNLATEFRLVYYSMKHTPRGRATGPDAHYLAESPYPTCAPAPAPIRRCTIWPSNFSTADYDRATAYGFDFDDAIRCKSVTQIPNSFGGGEDQRGRD
ncbi:MAG: hypothetical protein ACLRMJ_09990 [Alistipes finegoldii]